jgi:hypothetical protein
VQFDDGDAELGRRVGERPSDVEPERMREGAEDVQGRQARRAPRTIEVVQAEQYAVAEDYGGRRGREGQADERRMMAMMKDRTGTATTRRQLQSRTPWIAHRHSTFTYIPINRRFVND